MNRLKIITLMTMVVTGMLFNAVAVSAADTYKEPAVEHTYNAKNNEKFTNTSYQKWQAELNQPAVANWPDEQSTELVTPLGKLRGVKYGDIRIFRGIPYAKATDGKRRFAPPEKEEAWQGVKDATRFGKMAPQPWGAKNISEDCLSLNVWTPVKKSQEKLPVYVFIHGGGYLVGAGSLAAYEGTELAKSGIVVVTLNYRMGALGFLASKTTQEKYGTTGNWGILDMICGLQWVRDNIESFGGDPQHVTIGGESAGSFAVSTLISSPEAKGLFQQAIMESGALPNTKTAAMLSSYTLPVALERSHDFMALFSAKDDVAGLEKLRKVPVQDILAAKLPEREDISISPSLFWPSPDGKVIPENATAEIKKGNINSVKLLMGFNTDEGSMFAKPDSTVEDYRNLVKNIFGMHAPEVLERYPVTEKETAEKRISQIVTLAMLRSGMYEYADALAKEGQDVYAYHFDFADPLLKNTEFGVAHASELRYIFHFAMDDITNDSAAQKVANEMYTAWTNFIKTGDPNKGIPLPQNVIWEKYNDKNRAELHIEEKSKMEPLWKADDVDFINQMMYESEK